MTTTDSNFPNKILIVDDDPSLLRLLGIRLTAAGYNVESAASAKIALGILKSFHPQMVISDLRMEGMDGMALLREVRLRDPDLPVILITGHGDISTAVEAMREGAWDFLEKPFAGERLVALAGLEGLLAALRVVENGAKILRRNRRKI